MAHYEEMRLYEARKRRERYTASMQLIPNENGYGFSVSFPGFKYGDFSRTGLISLPELLKYFEATRYRRIVANGLDVSELQTIFVLQSRIEISMELHKTARIMINLKKTNEISHIGNSTISFRSNLLNETSGAVLATRFLDLVHVNSATRKSQPFPPSFKQKTRNISSLRHIQPPPRMVLPLVDMKNCYCCKITVNNLDMDENNHTTQLKYVVFVLECAAQATASGHYKRLKDDIYGYCVKSASFVHIGESRAGDELLLMTWEDLLNPLLIYFVIRKDSKDICHSQMEFYDTYVHSNL